MTVKFVKPVDNAYSDPGLAWMWNLLIPGHEYKVVFDNYSPALGYHLLGFDPEILWEPEAFEIISKD